MSNVEPISITHRFATDRTAIGKVDTTQLDTQLGNLAANDNAQTAALDAITDGENQLAPNTVGLAQLRPEVLRLLRGESAASTASSSFPVINLLDYGGNPLGDADNTLAMSRAMAAANLIEAQYGGARIYAPRGRYRFIDPYPGYTPDTSDGWLYDGPVQHISITSNNITIEGDGIGQTEFISGEASCFIAAHHSGQLNNVVLRDISFINDKGLNTVWTTSVMFYSGQVEVIRCEHRDWAIGFYGRAPARKCIFERNRFVWTRGRESIGYMGHSSNWAHPCVGIIWPGDDCIVNANNFDGAEDIVWQSGSQPVDWPLPDAQGDWPDICREPADGLVLNPSNGGVFVNNIVRRNGVEGIYCATCDDPERPVDFVGNNVDAVEWRGTAINYPSYGIVAEHRSNVTITGNAIHQCNMGIRVDTCGGTVGGNTLSEIGQGIWVIDCVDMMVIGNRIACKQTFTSDDLLSIYAVVRGIYWGTPLRSKCIGNVCSGPAKGFGWKTIHLTADLNPGDLSIYVDDTTGLTPTVVPVTSGDWLIFGLNVDGSFADAIPIGAVFSDHVDALNTDWTDDISPYPNGTTITVYKGNPEDCAGIRVSTAVDSSIENNIINGFIFGIAHDSVTTDIYATGNIITDSLTRITPKVKEFSPDGNGGTIVDLVINGTLSWPGVSSGTCRVTANTAADQDWLFESDFNSIQFKATAARRIRWRTGTFGAAYSTMVSLEETGAILLGDIADTGEGKGVQVAGYLRLDVGAPLKRGTANAGHDTANIATLVGGTVTVATTAVTSNSRIHYSRQTAGGTLGHLSVGAIVAGTSFVLQSSSATDTSTIYWTIEEP